MSEQVDHTNTQSTGKKVRKTQVKQSDVPRHSLRDALRIPHTICDSYGKLPTKPLSIAIGMDTTPTSGSFKMLCGAASAYGLTLGSYTSDVIALTDLGRRVVAPTSEGDDNAAMREALLRPRVINEFLTRYNNSRLPSEKIARNVLEEIGVPSDSSQPVLDLILTGAEQVGFLRKGKGGAVFVDLDSALSPNKATDDDYVPDDDPSPIEPTQRTPSGNGQSASMSQIATSVAQNSRVFITHGKNSAIVNQLKELLAFGKFEPVVAAENETISKPVPDKVMDDMRSCYAAIIHVGKETKVLDHEGNEHVFLNQNVLIEIGAAMALYNRRFILLVERGATLPSNLQGLYEVRYEGDKLDYEATMKLLRAFNDFRN